MSDYASCCVLSYQRPEFLARCLHSLRENAGYPLELIVHDDGSQDPQLLHYLHDLQKQGAISALILNPPGHNQGVGTAMKRMFQLASGDPIIKIDQDLEFQTNWLARLVSILEYNRAVWCETFMDPTPEQPRIGALGAFKYPVDPVDSEKMFLREFGTWEEHHDFVGSLMAIPRDIYEDYGPFEEHSDAFAEDIEFKHKLRQAGLAMGLPADDVAINYGFGPGPSTVVEKFEDGEGTVHKIHHGPLVFP